MATKKIKKQAKGPKERSKLADTMPNLGPGLFLDERARIGTTRTYRAILSFLRTVSIERSGVGWREARQHLRPVLENIVQRYWADSDYDKRLTWADMKLEVRRLRQRLRRLQAAIDELPRPVAQALNFEISRRAGDGLVVSDHLTRARTSNVAIECACKPILKRRSKKTPSLSVRQACAALLSLREAITGQPFTRTWATVKTRDRLVAARGPREFASTDALFVQVALGAIDPTVTISTIRSGLKDVAQAKPKSKLRKKSARF